MGHERRSSLRFLRPVFYTVCALLIVAVVISASEVMLPFVLAPVVAYVLTPLVAWLEKKRIPRAGAIVGLYVVLLTVLIGGVSLAAPRVVVEVQGLKRELPQLGKKLQTVWVPQVQGQLRAWGLAQPDPSPAAPAIAPLNGAIPPDDGSTDAVKDEPALLVRPEPDGTVSVEVRAGLAVRPDKHGGFIVEPHKDEIGRGFDLNRTVAESAQKGIDYAKVNAMELVKVGTGVIRGVSRALFIFSITLMLAAYLMLTREKVWGFFRNLVRPASRTDFESLVARIDRGLSGVVRGQLVICLVNGSLTAVGFGLANIKYWPVLALVATVFSLIPIFGAFISSVPAVALALTDGPGKAAFVLIWIFGIHQLEANFLNPKIMGDAAKIHPFLVVLSLLVGEHFFKATGALLAVPCMSIVQSLFLHFRAIIEARDPDFAGESAARETRVPELPDSVEPPAPTPAG